jgi:phospholipid/cholesterol/gamma-HCH transport system ATP-binding protein
MSPSNWGRNVLDDLTFDIKKGEIFAIVGPSGTGKSVTLKHMVRLLTPTRGAVWIDGVEVSAANGDELARVREGSVTCFRAARCWVG